MKGALFSYYFIPHPSALIPALTPSLTVGLLLRMITVHTWQFDK
jgi:hypothetical protein